MIALRLDMLGDDEPLTVQEVAWQCRLDEDVAQTTKDYLATVVIPAARQLAETRSGAAIRPGRFLERVSQEDGYGCMGRYPRRLEMLLGTATVIESVEVGGVRLAPEDYVLYPGRPEARLVGKSPLPNAGVIEVTYQAGIDITQFPSVKQWLLLAAGWIFEQPEMYTVAKAVTALPADYVDALLEPIKGLPRF